MNRIKQGIRRLNQYTGDLITIALVSIILPLLVLSGFGLYSIIRHGYATYFAFLMLLSVLLVLVLRWIGSNQDKIHQNNTAQDIFVEPSLDWSEAELNIWNKLNASIASKLKENSAWHALKGHGLELAFETAQAFGKKELDFTLPEGLQLLEEISRRYRKVLNDHIPAIDKVSIAQAKWLYDAQNKHGGSAHKLYKRGTLVWRVLRLLNPATAIANELKGKIFSSMTEQAYTNLQRNAKLSLLQEVVKVCIDLYSGRYTIEQSSIKNSNISQKDNTQLAVALEPIRVAIVGQISAGKSSLVNVLIKKIHAEVDPLPTTDDICVYPFMIDNEEHLRLIDMPGLDGSKATQKSILAQVTHSDLVLWVLKANQPSRQLDVELLEEINEFYARQENISLKRPRIVAVLNHVDRLKPLNDWAPPYDLNDSSSEKAKTILAAVEFNRTLFKVDDIYPLALPEGKPMFGVEQLADEIQRQYDYAKNVQLNRRRNETRDTEGLMGESVRLFKVGKEIVKNLV